MQAKDAFDYLPQMMAVLIDRAGGQITFTEAEVRRIADMQPVLEVYKEEGFTGNKVYIRYRETTVLQGEAIDAIPGEIEAS